MIHPMRERRFYGSVAVGERGQIVIPKEARSHFKIKPGDKLIVLGRGDRGLVLLKADEMKEFAEKILKNL